MNLEDVAKLAGVSRSTVSRVLNGEPGVSQRARERVQDVVRRYDYHPNAAARSLASRRTRILGMLVSRPTGQVFGDPFFSLLVEGAIQACDAADHNLMMLIEPSDDSPDVNRMYHRIIRGHHLDGLIIASSVMGDPVVKRLEEDGFPFVTVGRSTKDQVTNCVDIDNRAAARTAVEHLLGHGHRRIAMVGGPMEMLSAADRHDGYLEALREAGLTPETELVRFTDFTAKGAYDALESLLPQRPEAVFFASDLMALGALPAFWEAGVRIPDDVAIMGLSGQEEGAASRPPLSTVSRDVHALGRAAVEMLLEVIEKPGHRPARRQLPTELVIRRSCGCAGDTAEFR